MVVLVRISVFIAAVQWTIIDKVLGFDHLSGTMAHR